MLANEEDVESAMLLETRITLAYWYTSAQTTTCTSASGNAPTGVAKRPGGQKGQNQDVQRKPETKVVFFWHRRGGALAELSLSP